jgi:hypothetical protein
MSKAGRNIGSGGIELHGTDRVASRTRAGDKSYLFIDQTRTRSINYFNHHLIKNLSNLTTRYTIASSSSLVRRFKFGSQSRRGRCLARRSWTIILRTPCIVVSDISAAGPANQGIDYVA